METGPGKIYAYLRSVFELNRRYGFTKFIIAVPSIAIKEGTYKSLQMTEEHFKGLYDTVRFDYFVYDSQKLGQVRACPARRFGLCLESKNLQRCPSTMPGAGNKNLLAQHLLNIGILKALKSLIASAWHLFRSGTILFFSGVQPTSCKHWVFEGA